MMGRLLIFLLLIIEIKGRCHHLGSALKCTGLTTFPNGSHNWAETVIISNSNLSELKAYNFYHAGFCNAKNVYLQNDNITNIHPNAFAEMSQVVQLDLSENKLITFHKYSFIGLISVKILKLAKNEIEFIPGKVLRHLHSLEILDLSHNSLRTLSTGFLKWTSIKELYIGNNPLELPDRGAILESNSLTHLSLDSCGLESLPSDAFSKLPNIEYLDFSFNKLKVLPEDLLKGQDHLKHLDISYNAISRVEVFHIPTNLREFYWDGNPCVDDFSCKHLLEEKVSPKLENEDGENPSTSTTKPKMHLEVNSNVDAGHSELPTYAKNVEADLLSALLNGDVVKNRRRDNYHANKPTSVSIRQADSHQKPTLRTDVMHQNGNRNEGETSVPNISKESSSIEDNGRSVNSKMEDASNVLILSVVVVVAAGVLVGIGIHITSRN